MVLHAVPVLRVEGGLAHIQAVRRGLHILGRGLLSRHRADIVAEEHGVGAQDLIAHGVLSAVPLHLRVHHAVIVFL